MNTASCKSCGQSIIWVTSPAGANMPLDARPWRDLNDTGVMAVLRATVLYGILPGDPPEAVKYTGDPETAEGRLYLSHFVTCPTREQHRKKR